MKKAPNVLCISCKVGGGHIQAAKERIKQLRSESSDLRVIEKDILIDLVAPLFGGVATWFMNLTLKKRLGTAIKNLIYRGQPISDYIVLPFWVFTKTRKLLVAEDIDKVIVTQPASLLTLMQAIRSAEKRLNKIIDVELIVSELPTDKTVSFFNPIRRLTPRHRNRLSLSCIKPFLLPGETEKVFWKKQCGLTLNQISYTNFPLRSEFLLAPSKASVPRKTTLTFHYPKTEDIEALAPFCEHTTLQVTRTSHDIKVHLNENTILTTIMLGSRPLEKALLQYLDSFTKMLCHKTADYNHLVIPICSDTSSLVTSVFSRLKKRLLQKAPDNLMVLPIPFQEAPQLVPLILRSDATITRSGGMTSVELLHVAKGQIWIHSDLPSQHTWLAGSLLDMPTWEIGNAEYLIQSKQAHIIHPSTLSTQYTKLLEQKKQVVIG